MSAHHNERSRKDTSTRPLDHYERCAWIGGHQPSVPADVAVADIPFCLEHGWQRLAGILNGLPHADRYYEDGPEQFGHDGDYWRYASVYHEEVPT